MRTHVYPLDAVRFLAAFSVLAFHLAFYDWAAPYSTVGRIYHRAASYPELAAWTWFGWVGVQVFFVISGFVIANSANNASPMRFAKSRVLRLYPAVWVCAFITLGAWLLIDHADWRHLMGEMARSLSLWISGPWIDGVYWTLAIEMMFYVFVFVVLLSRQFQRLPLLAVALTAYSGAYLLPQIFVGSVLADSGIWRVLSTHSELLLMRHGCFFGVGMLMWLASVRNLRWWELAGLAFGVLCCCFEISLRTITMNSGEVNISLAMPVQAPVLVWLSVLALMFVFVLAPERFSPRSPRRRAFLEHLGKMTYPLYLAHSVVGAGLMRVLLEAGVNRWSALATAVIAMLLLASLIAQFAEPAMRSVLRTAWERVERGLQNAPAFAFLFRSGGVVSPVRAS